MPREDAARDDLLRSGPTVPPPFVARSRIFTCLGINSNFPDSSYRYEIRSRVAAAVNCRGCWAIELER